jgi:transcriptional regulator with XRE-family HTH domain
MDVSRIAQLAMPDRSAGTLLVGARYREGMTQAELSEKTGISRRHISEMENNKRVIGKGNAKKLAEALNMDYRMLL